MQEIEARLFLFSLTGIHIFACYFYLQGTSRKSSLTLVHTPILDEAEENQEEEDDEEEEEESEEDVEEDKEEAKIEDPPSLSESSQSKPSEHDPLIKPSLTSTMSTGSKIVAEVSQPIPSIAVKQQTSVVVAKQPTSVKILPAVTVKQPMSMASKPQPQVSGRRRKSSIAPQPIVITTLRIKAASGNFFRNLVNI